MLIDNVNLEDIYRFMETGNPDNAPVEIVAYLEALTRVHGMLLRIDKFGSREAVIKHLVVSDKLSRLKASQLCSEAIEYFYVDKEVSKKAWANFYANIVDQEINFLRLTKKDGQDSKRVAELAKIAAEMRGVYNEDKEELPAELFQKPVVIYTTDISDLGLPKVDRNRIKEMIDTKFGQLTEKERQRLYQEADVIPFKALPNEQEDPRKS
jgi:hypothetical protein